MKLPRKGDFIDIHTHEGKPSEQIFFIENMMAHEDRTPGDLPQQACSYGVHPWYLNENNYERLIDNVSNITSSPNLILIGESGFDKLRGPSMELQRRAFERHVALSEAFNKPVVVHCVRAWEELLGVHKKVRPKMPWLIHGFRGTPELAAQLLSKNMYLSIWFDFVIRPESAQLLRKLPVDRIFLETDGADVDIIEIYRKVAADLYLTVDELKAVILSNFTKFFYPPFEGQGG